METDEYEDKRDRAVHLPPASRVASFLEIIVQHMGPGIFKCITYSSTVTYMHITTMSPQCDLSWLHKCKWVKLIEKLTKKKKENPKVKNSGPASASAKVGGIPCTQTHVLETLSLKVLD